MRKAGHAESTDIRPSIDRLANLTRKNFSRANGMSSQYTNEMQSGYFFTKEE